MAKRIKRPSRRAIKTQVISRGRLNNPKLVRFRNKPGPHNKLSNRTASSWFNRPERVGRFARMADRVDNYARRQRIDDRSDSGENTHRVTTKAVLRTTSTVLRHWPKTKSKKSNDTTNSVPRVIHARIKRKVETDVHAPAPTKQPPYNSNISLAIKTNGQVVPVAAPEAQPERRPGSRIKTEVPKRTPAYKTASILARSERERMPRPAPSRIRTGRYVPTTVSGSVKRGSKPLQFTRLHTNSARINQSKTHDSGMEGITLSRSGYRRSVNTIRTAKNTVTAVRKTGRAARKIYSRTRTTVRNVRRAVNVARNVSAVYRAKAVVAAVKKAVMAVKMLANPVVLKVLGIAAAAVLLIIIVVSVITLVSSIINDTFGWLYREDQTEVQAYHDYVSGIEHYFEEKNNRMQLVLSDPGTVGAEFAFLGSNSDNKIDVPPTDQMVGISLIVRNRMNKKSYTAEDFENAMYIVREQFYRYSESIQTVFFPHSHGSDPDGNPIPCSGHIAVYIFGRTFDPETVMANLSFSSDEVRMYQEYMWAIAYLKMPDHPNQILIQDPNAHGLIWPAPYLSSISSRYGWRNDPFHGSRQYHYGIDLVGDASKNETTFQSPTVAVFDGVASTGYNNQRGNFVEIHGTINNNQYTARYFHLDVVKVRDGSQVTAGDVIGFVGSTGRSTGDHLHFELLINNNYVDPYSYIKP